LYGNSIIKYLCIINILLIKATIKMILLKFQTCFELLLLFSALEGNDSKAVIILVGKTSWAPEFEKSTQEAALG
jgi:hypothetical protein